MGALFKERLDKKYYQSHNATYIRDLTDLVLSVKPDYFVTFTFANPNVSEHVAINTLSTWLKWVNRSIFGRRSKERLVIFPFMERNGSDGIHFHLMVKLPLVSKNINMYDIFKKKWLNLKGAGRSTFRNREPDTGEFKWFKSITDHSGLVEYVNKEAREQRMDNLVVECWHYNQ
jgi:hypothetical protein